MDKNGKKIMLIFDLDNTILSDTTDYCIMKLLSNNLLVDLPEPTGRDSNWAEYMQKVYLRMKEHSINISQIKSTVESIPINDGFSDLFKLIRNYKDRFDTLIISGSNTLYIKWLIEHHKLDDIFSDYIANFAEPHDDLLIQITQNHIHDCENCEQAQCKRILLDAYLARVQEESLYANILYVGDGENDYCPSILLKNSDYLFPRENYTLHHKLYKNDYAKFLKCQIHPWNHGEKIVKIVKNLL